MTSVVRAIVLAAIAQVMILALLIGYLFVHTDNMARTYALSGERSAKSYTKELVHDQYNRLQLERSQEREDMRQFVERRISLRIDEAMKQK